MFCAEKKFWSKKIVGPKKFVGLEIWSKKSFGQKKILGLKMFFWSEKNFRSKKILSKNLLVQKKFWLKIHIDSYFGSTRDILISKS